MITSKEFWNKRSRIYDDQVGPMYEDAYRKTIANTLKYMKQEDVVLDFACGTGIVTLSLAAHAKEVMAIDIADEMIAITKKKVEEQQLSNVRVAQLDLFDESLKANSFNLIAANNVLLYVENIEEVLKRIHNLLKPDGIFVSATDCLGGLPTKEGLQKFWRSRTGKMPYVAFYTQKRLENIIAQNGFDVLERENLFPAPPNLFVAAKKK